MYPNTNVEVSKSTSTKISRTEQNALQEKINMEIVLGDKIKFSPKSKVLRNSELDEMIK